MDVRDLLGFKKNQFGQKFCRKLSQIEWQKNPIDNAECRGLNSTRREQLTNKVIDCFWCENGGKMLRNASLTEFCRIVLVKLVTKICKQLGIHEGRNIKSCRTRRENFKFAAPFY
jgi:hypothetical protein